MHSECTILMQISQNFQGETPRTPTCGRGLPPPPPSPFRRFAPQRSLRLHWSLVPPRQWRFWIRPWFITTDLTMKHLSQMQRYDYDHYATACWYGMCTIGNSFLKSFVLDLAQIQICDIYYCDNFSAIWFKYSHGIIFVFFITVSQEPPQMPGLIKQ